MNGSSIKIFPLLIIVSVLAFSVRLTEVLTGISTISNIAMAEEKPDKAEDIKESNDIDETDHPKDNAGDSNPHIVEDSSEKVPEWHDASYTDIGAEEVKMQLLDDLSSRRKSLDKSERRLAVREALLKAAEKEIDLKFNELTKLKSEIEVLLGKQTKAEAARISSLVKIYEGMKPKDAARIFDTLDIDVLVSVISKMSERKVAPVMAAMNPERARTITIMLAEQRTLPKL